MKLTLSELEFLAARAREEWEPACYQLPAHRLQMAHEIPGASLIALINAWTVAEAKKDQEILRVANNPTPAWPWSSINEMRSRLLEAQQRPRERQTTASR